MVVFILCMYLLIPIIFLFLVIVMNFSNGHETLESRPLSLQTQILWAQEQQDMTAYSKYDW